MHFELVNYPNKSEHGIYLDNDNKDTLLYLGIYLKYNFKTKVVPVLKTNAVSVTLNVVDTAYLFRIIMTQTQKWKGMLSIYWQIRAFPICFVPF